MNKNRDLPISDFFENLQKEYICAELRTKIFSKTHSQYWKKVMEGKKDKIENIAARNRFLSIFDNKGEYSRIYLKVVPEWGLPEFMYVSDNQKLKLSKWDTLFFFSKGCEVKVLQEDGTYTLGEVIDNFNIFNENSRVEVKLKGSAGTSILPIYRLSRVL